MKGFLLMRPLTVEERDALAKAGDDGALAFGSVKDGIGARVQARDCSSGGRRRAGWTGQPRKQ